MDATLALATYNYQQSLSSSNTGAATTPAGSSPGAATVQAAIASAQSTAFASLFNLIG
ncbi:hypothetical protein [Geothrix sp. PMB-07]|uniref:hypothetical protein n=1 Tax=Geothrix sp. PMB-07 TaxID=3068640 RepID=UPI0027406C06|nr:hypothetical protein [Geothrix sp. PMB-07]WLT31138.1 hypothetical protein Q9293_15585 [Geothrix sp. PMB-07]